MADTATPQAAANPFSASANSSPLSSAKSSPVGAAQKPPAPLLSANKTDAPLGGLAPRSPVEQPASQPAVQPTTPSPLLQPAQAAPVPDPVSPAAPQTTVKRPTTTVRPKMRPDWEVAKLQNAGVWNKGRTQLPGDYTPQAEHMYADADQLRGLAAGQLTLSSEAEVQEFMRQHPDVEGVYTGLNMPDGPERVQAAIAQTAKQKLQHIEQASAAWRAAHEAEPGTDGALRVHGRQDLRDLSAKPIPFSEQAELAPARLPGLKDYAESHGVQVEDPEFERYWAAKGPVGSQGGFSQDNPYSRIREYRSMQKAKMKDTRSLRDEDAFLQYMKLTPSRLNGESAQTAVEMGKSPEDALLEYQIENAQLKAQPGEGTGNYSENLANIATGEGFKNYGRTALRTALAVPDAAFGAASIVPSAFYDLAAGAAGYKTNATQRAAKDIMSPLSAVTGSSIGDSEQAALSQVISDYGGDIADGAAKSNNPFYRYGAGFAGRAVQVAPSVIGSAAMGMPGLAAVEALPAASAPVQQLLDDTGVGAHQRRWSTQLQNHANDVNASGYTRPLAGMGAAALDTAPALLTGGAVMGGAKALAGGVKRLPFATTAAKANMQGALNSTGQVGKSIAGSAKWPVGIAGGAGALDSALGQGQPAMPIESAIEQYAAQPTDAQPTVAGRQPPVPPPSDAELPVENPYKQPPITPASDSEAAAGVQPGAQPGAQPGSQPGSQPGVTAQGIIADGLTTEDLSQLLTNPNLRQQVMQGGPAMHKLLLSQLDGMAGKAGKPAVTGKLQQAKFALSLGLTTEDHVLGKLNEEMGSLTGNAPGVSLTPAELRALLAAA